MMKHKSIYLTILFLVMVFTGCSNNSEYEAKLATYQSKCDSLTQENQQISAFLKTISESMDSIFVQENALLTVNTERNAKSVRQQMKDNLLQYSKILNRQKDKIAQLRDSLNKNGGKYASKYKLIIDGLNAQIAQKDTEIERLNKELENKNANISTLQRTISSLNDDIASLNEVNESQIEALEASTEMLNTAYVKIASKKELNKLGLLKGGFLKKKKLDAQAIDPEICDKIDIRNTTQFNIPGKNPKILTQMPQNSYRIEKNNNGTSTLTITDTSLFWSISNFLIVQY